MAFVKMTDATGTLNLVVFPKIYKDTQEIWSEAKPILVSGRVDVRDEEVNLIVENVFTKENATQKDALFFVRIPKNTDISKLKEIKQVFLANPGTQKVTLLFEGNNEKVTFPQGISWSEELSHIIAQILAE